MPKEIKVTLTLTVPEAGDDLSSPFVVLKSDQGFNFIHYDEEGVIGFTYSQANWAKLLGLPYELETKQVVK